MANEFGVETPTVATDDEIGAMPMTKMDGEDAPQTPGTLQSKVQTKMFDIAAAKAADNENEEAFAGMPTADLRKRLEYTRLEARARMMASSPDNFQDEEFGAIFKELNARRFIADERTLAAFDVMDGDRKVTNLSRLNEFLAFSDKLSAAKSVEEQQSILEDRLASPELKAWREAKENGTAVEYARRKLEEEGRDWGDKVAGLREMIPNPNEILDRTVGNIGVPEEMKNRNPLIGEYLSDERAVKEYEERMQNDVLRTEAAKVMPFLTEAQRNLVNIYAAGGEVPQGVFKVMKPEDREMMYSMCQAVRPEWNGNWLEEMGVRAYGGVRSAFRSMNRADKAFTDVVLNKAGQFLFGKDNMWSTPEEREALRKGMIDDIHWAESVHDLKLKDPKGFVKKALEGYADSASMQYSMLGGEILKRAGAGLKGTWGGVAASSAGWALEGYTAASMIGEQFDNMLLRGVPLENAAPLAVCGGLVDTYIETMNLKTWFGKNLTPAEMKRVGIRAGFRAALKMDGKEFLKVLKTNAKQAIQIAESEVKEEMLQGANKEGWCSLAEGRNALDAFTSSDVYREGMNSFWDALPSCTAFGVFGAADPTGSISKSANGAYQEHLQQISGIVAKRMGLKDVGSATEQYAYQMAQNEAARIAKATEGMSVKERNAWINAQTDLSLAEKEFYAEHCDMFAASVAQDGAAWANAHLSGSINEAMFVKAGWKFGHDEQGYINSVTTSQGDVIPVEFKNREARIEDFDGKRLDEFVSEYNRLNPDNPLNKDDADAVSKAVSLTNGWYANGKITLFGARASVGTLAHESTHAMIKRLSEIGTKEANQAVKALVSTLGGKGRTISLAGEESVAYENEYKASAAELANLGLKDEVSIKALAKNIVTAVKKAVGRGKGQEFVQVYRTAEGIEYDPSEFLHDVIARSLAAYQRKQDLATAQAKERKEAVEKFKAEREAKRQKKIDMRKAEAAQREEEAKAREDALKSEAESSLKAKQEELKKSAMEVAERNRVEAEFRKMWEDRLAIAADQRKAAEAVANYEAWKNDEAHKEDVRKAQDALMQEVLAEIAKEEQDALDAIDRKYGEEFKLLADEEERNEAIRKAEETRQAKMAEQMLKNRKNATKEPPRLGHAKNQDGETAQRARAAYLAAWKAKMGKTLSQAEVDQLAEVYGLPPEAVNLVKGKIGWTLTDKQLMSDESLAKLSDGLIKLYGDIASVKIIVPDVVVGSEEEAANAVPNEVYDPVSDTFIEGRIVVDAANAKTLREQAGLTEPSVTPEEIEEARQRRAEQRKVPSGKQKSADTDYPSAADEIREYKFSIGSVTPEEDETYEDAVKRGDMDTAQRMVDDVLSRVGAFWHGTPSGILKGSSNGLHIGTKQAAREALEARIGKRDDGKDWDGTQEYGSTLLKGYQQFDGTYSESHYPISMPPFADGTLMTPEMKPWLRPVLIVGKMTNTKYTPISDSAANRRIVRKRGAYYINEGEDAGSVSAVLPSGESVIIKLPDAATYDDNGNLIPLSKRFDKSNPDIHFSLGKKAREDAIALIERKRPDLYTEKKVRMIIDEMRPIDEKNGFYIPDVSYIAGITGTNDTIDETVDNIGKFATTKEQKAALHWFIKGAIRLPEDAPKVTEAIKYGERAKGKANTDPMSYDSPMAMIEALHEFKPKAKPIDPDKVSQLSDKREMGYGVVTYLVQDDREGQQAMREIINTHWGEDANPWCLLSGDGYGNLSDGTNGGYDAWYYWTQYNSLPKRVAFKNGKLLAFMATYEKPETYHGWEYQMRNEHPQYMSAYNKYVDEMYEFGKDFLSEEEWMQENHSDEWDSWLSRYEGSVAKEQWWDRKDASHEGIPLGNIPVPGDAFGRWADFEIRDGELKQIGGYKKGDVGGVNYTKWYANGNKAEESVGESIANFEYKEWDEKGNLTLYKVEKDASTETFFAYDGGVVLDNAAINGKRINLSHTFGSERSEAERIYRENAQNRETRFSLGNERTTRFSLISKNTAKSWMPNTKVIDADGFPKVVYHGTTKYGFTKFDTLVSDDGISLFFTDSIPTAKTYSGVSGVREISDKDYQGDIIEEAEKRINEVANDIYSKANKLYPYSFDFQDLSDMLKRYANDVADGKMTTDTAYEKVYEDLTDNIAHAWEPSAEYEEFADWQENSSEFGELCDLFEEATAAVMSYRDAVVRPENSGNYQLYLNIENPLVIDAKGSNWNGIDAYNIGGVDGAKTNTRVIAKYAKEHGYDGVIIENLIDNGGKGIPNAEPTNIYIAFNSNQVKSADGTTYDDEGNAIPLEKRGNLNNTDIRFSISSVTDAAAQDPLTPDVSTRFSITNEKDLKRVILDEFRGSVEARDLEWTDDQITGAVEGIFEIIAGVHAAVKGDKNYAEAAKAVPTLRVDWRDGAEKPIATWVRGNIEYKYDMSADTLCINNEGLEQMLSDPTMADLMIAFSEDTEYGSDDYLRLYETLRDMGYVVPCKGCFDAAMRMKMLPSVAQKFIAEVNAVIDERNKNPKKFDADIRAKAKPDNASVEGLPLASGTESEAIRIGVAGDKLTKHIDWTQLMSAKGQTKALMDWGGIFRAWQKTGAGRPKDKLLPEAYGGVIISSTTTIIGKAGEKTPSFRDLDVNQGTGLRRNSHSEFRPTLIVDEIQFLRDCWLKGLCVFKYMKELDDVRLFGRMGIKYNMSAFPAFVEGCTAAGLDKNGNYVWAEESVGGREFEYKGKDGKIHYDGAKGFAEAQKYINKDVSLSCVIFSVPHLIKAMTDVPTKSDKRGLFGSLIGFHNSGADAKALEIQGLGKERACLPNFNPFEVEAMTDYHLGVTNFEQVQNDRFGEGWKILLGKKAGTDVKPGHKIEFANGTIYRNDKLGVTIYSSEQTYRKNGGKERFGFSGPIYILDREGGKVAHSFDVSYNDKVRELGGDYAYQDAADFYIKEFAPIGILPRFDFNVPADVFVKMCKDAKVDPHHPKLGWNGGAWSPIHSEAYYSLFCDFGMTDPKTGKWSPHLPVLDGQRNADAFKNALPADYLKIIKASMKNFTRRKDRESKMDRSALLEYSRRSIQAGKVKAEKVRKVLAKHGFSASEIASLDPEFARAKNVGKVKKPSKKTGKLSIGNRSAENVAKFYLAREIIENKGRLPDTRRAMAVAKVIGYNGSVENLLRAAEQEAATQTQLLRYIASDPKTEKVLVRAGLALRNERAIERARSAAVQFSREVSEAAEGTKKATERAVRQMRGEDYDQMLAREGLDLNAILLAIRPEEREQVERNDGAAEPKKPVVLDEASRNAVAQMAQEAVKNGAERIKEAQAMIAAKREDSGKKREDSGKKREDPSDPNGDIEYGNAVSAAFHKAIAEAGLTLDSPEAMVQLVKAITEKYIKDYPAEFTNLDPADIWSSPLARAKFAANLGAFAQAVADAYAPSYARVRIAKKAQLLNDKGLTSMRMIEEVGEELFRDLHGDVIRQSREGLIKDIKKILKPHAQHYTENELKQDRKGVDSALGRYCKFAYKCIKMSAAQVEERAKELEDELATWSGVAESEAERYREFADKKMELEMLDMFGNLKSRMPSELTALRDFVEQTINESRWETMQFGEKWEQSRVAGADAMMGGIEGDPKNGGVQPEDDDVSGLYSLIGMMETKGQQLTRFCRDDARRGGSLKAFGMVEEMIQRAEDIQYNYAQMQKARFVDLCKQVYGSEAQAAEALSADIDKSLWSELDRGEQKTAWTIGRVMQMYVSCVQSDYAENCARYGRDGKYVQMLEDIINSMNPKHMDFIKGMRSMYMEQGDALSEVLERTTGTRLLTPNRLYMPVQMLRDNNIAQKGRARAYNPFAPSLTPRVKNGLDFDQTMDIIDMWQSRLDDTAHTIAWADTGSMVQGICLSDRVLKAIRQAHGTKVMKQWNRYILDILAGAETGKIDNSNWGVKSMRFCARLASRTWLMLNPASWSKQLAAVPCFALSADGNLKDVAKSLSFCALHPFKAARVMRDLSETSAFKARYGVAISQEMKYATSNKGRFNTWIGKLVDIGMAGTMKFDQFGVYLLAGAYHNKRCEIEAQGKSAQEASELASSWLMHIVDKTAQTTRAVNTTELQRAGGAWGILLQFKSAPAQQTQFEISAMQDALANPNDAKRWKKAAVCVLINHIIVPTINTAIESVLTCLTGWGLPDDEKRKRLVEMWIANCVSGSLGSIVFIGTIAEAAGNLIGKVAVGDEPNMYDIRNSVGRQIPAAEMLNLWLNNGDKAIRAFCDITNGDIEDGVYELSKAILAVTPGASWASRKGFKAYESATDK